MLDFTRTDFDKQLRTSSLKKIEIKSKYELVKLGDVVEINYGDRIVRRREEGTIYPVYGGGGETFRADNYNRENAYIISRFGMSPECVRYVNDKFFLNDSGMTVDTINAKLTKEYLDIYLYQYQDYIYKCGRGVAQKNIDIPMFKGIKIPLPPLDIQQKIVDEYNKVDDEYNNSQTKISNYRNLISQTLNTKATTLAGGGGKAL